MWYIYTREYYSAIKNEVMPFAATWMDLEIVTLSEASQTQKGNMTALMWGGTKKNGCKRTYKTEVKSQMCNTNLEDEGGINGQIRMALDTLVYIKQTSSKAYCRAQGTPVSTP